MSERKNAIHWTELEEDTSGRALATESNVYRREIGRQARPASGLGQVVAAEQRVRSPVAHLLLDAIEPRLDRPRQRVAIQAAGQREPHRPAGSHRLAGQIRDRGRGIEAGEHVRTQLFRHREPQRQGRGRGRHGATTSTVAV